MSTNQNQSGFGRRLWRAFIAILALATFLLILGAVGAAAYFGFIEFQRVQARMNSNDSSVALLRSDVNDLMTDSPSQQEVERLRNTIADLEAELAQLQGDLSSDIDRQQEVLNTLSESVGDSGTQFSTLESNINTLNEALIAIQGDIIENGTRIDSLGGEVDNVQTAVTDLGTEMIAMEEEAMSMIEEIGNQDSLQETLALFRVWELITRARLRLLEDNIGLAANDIEEAIQTVDALLLLDTLQTDPEQLETVQARLALAFVNLENRPELAASDLESAWDELDGIFTRDILTNVPLEEVEEETETAVEESSTEDTGEEDSTTEETSTPSPTPTPTATSSP